MQENLKRFLRQHEPSLLSGRRWDIKQAAIVSWLGCLPAEGISWLAEQQQQQQQ